MDISRLAIVAARVASHIEDANDARLGREALRNAARQGQLHTMHRWRDCQLLTCEGRDVYYSIPADEFVDINSVRTLGGSLIHVAIEGFTENRKDAKLAEAQLDMVTFLSEELGVDANSISIVGRTPLHLLAASLDELDIPAHMPPPVAMVRRLLSLGADPDAPDAAGATASDLLRRAIAGSLKEPTKMLDDERRKAALRLQERGVVATAAAIDGDDDVAATLEYYTKREGRAKQLQVCRLALAEASKQKAQRQAGLASARSMRHAASRLDLGLGLDSPYGRMAARGPAGGLAAVSGGLAVSLSSSFFMASTVTSTGDAAAISNGVTSEPRDPGTPAPHDSSRAAAPGAGAGAGPYGSPETSGKPDLSLAALGVVPVASPGESVDDSGEMEHSGQESRDSEVDGENGSSAALPLKAVISSPDDLVASLAGLTVQQAALQPGMLSSDRSAVQDSRPEQPSFASSIVAAGSSVVSTVTTRGMASPAPHGLSAAAVYQGGMPHGVLSSPMPSAASISTSGTTPGHGLPRSLSRVSSIGRGLALASPGRTAEDPMKTLLRRGSVGTMWSEAPVVALEQARLADYTDGIRRDAGWAYYCVLLCDRRPPSEISAGFHGDGQTGSGILATVPSNRIGTPSRPKPSLYLDRLDAKRACSPAIAMHEAAAGRLPLAVEVRWVRPLEGSARIQDAVKLSLRNSEDPESGYCVAAAIGPFIGDGASHAAHVCADQWRYGIRKGLRVRTCMGNCCPEEESPPDTGKDVLAESDTEEDAPIDPDDALIELTKGMDRAARAMDAATRVYHTPAVPAASSAAEEVSQRLHHCPQRHGIAPCEWSAVAWARAMGKVGDVKVLMRPYRKKARWHLKKEVFPALGAQKPSERVATWKRSVLVIAPEYEPASAKSKQRRAAFTQTISLVGSGGEGEKDVGMTRAPVSAGQPGQAVDVVVVPAAVASAVVVSGYMGRGSPSRPCADLPHITGSIGDRRAIAGATFGPDNGRVLRTPGATPYAIGTRPAIASPLTGRVLFGAGTNGYG